MGEDLVLVVELHTKHRIGQKFGDGALKFDDVFFCHVACCFL